MEDLGIVNLSMLLFVIVHWQTVDVEAKGFLAASEGTPIGTAAEQRKALKHQEQQVGSTRAFMLLSTRTGAVNSYWMIIKFDVVSSLFASLALACVFVLMF